MLGKRAVDNPDLRIEFKDQSLADLFSFEESGG